MHRIRLLAVLAFAALLARRAGARPRRSSGVVVSQVYAGGGNSGASFDHDFVELFNAGSAPSTSNGWTVQYASAASTSWQTTILAGSDPGRPLLPRPAELGRGGRRRAARRPTPPARPTWPSPAARSPSSPTSTALTCGASAGSCSAAASVEDFVGYGSASRLRGLGGGARAEQLDRGRCAPTPAAPTPTRTPTTSLRPRRRRATRRRRRRPAAAAPPPTGTAPQAAAVDVDVQPVLSLSLERPTISFGVGVLRRHAGADLRAGHGRQQQRRRLLADRPPHGVHAGRPAARAREHRARRRDARRRRSSAAPVPRSRSPPRPICVDRHDIGARARPAETPGRRRVGFTGPLPVGRSGPLLGDRHLHADRPVRLARCRRCVALAASASAGAARPPGRADRLAGARRHPRLGAGDGRR